MPLKYVAQADLENALGAATVLALYDDGSGSVNAAALEGTGHRAEAEVDSHLIGKVPYPVNPATDRLIKHCALEFWVCFSLERHPEYVRTFGEDPRAGERYERALNLMRRIAAAIQRLPDQVNGTPKNVGGSAQTAVPAAFTSVPEGHFDRGDF